MFLTEKLNDVIAKLSDIEEKYLGRRTTLDSQRYFSGWRASTDNVERKNDCVFIQRVVEWIADQGNRMEYLEKFGSMDPVFKHLGNDEPLDDNTKNKMLKKVYDISVVPYLSQAMLGAMVVTLSKITQSYTGLRIGAYDEGAVKNCSALAYVLVSEFNIDKLSDIDASKRLVYLRSLERFILVMEAAHQQDKSLSVIQWHPSFANEALLQQLSTQIQVIEREIAATADQNKASALSM